MAVLDLWIEFRVKTERTESAGLDKDPDPMNYKEKKCRTLSQLRMFLLILCLVAIGSFIAAHR